MTSKSQRSKFPFQRSQFPSPFALWVFAVTAKHENFTKAGEEIGLSQGAISYQMKELETSLGFALFDRFGRKVQLNELGKRLLPVVRGCFSELAEMIEILRQESRHRTSSVTIATTSFFASRLLSPRLAGFMSKNPGVGIQIIHEPDGRDVSNVADIEIRWGDGSWSDVEISLLFETPMTPMCSPSLLPSRRKKFKPGVLEGLMFLDDEKGAWEAWCDMFCKAAPPDVLTGPAIFDSAVRTQAAIDGQGFIVTNQLVNDDIVAGRLVAPFEGDLSGYGYYVAIKKKVAQVPVVRAFADWLDKEVARNTPTSIKRM